MKKESGEISGDARQVTDEDLRFLVSTIGENWELLGPLLKVSDVKIAHMKENYSTVERRIYHMFQTWKQQRNDGCSLEDLFSILRKANSSVQIDFDLIKHRFQESSRSDYLSSYTNPRNESEKVYKGPVQLRNTMTAEQPMSAQWYDHEGADIEKVPVDQIDAATISSMSARVRPVSPDDQRNINLNHVVPKEENRPVQESDIVGSRIEGAIQELKIAKESLQGRHAVPGQTIYERSNPDPCTAQGKPIREESYTINELFTSSKDKQKRECFHDGRLVILNQRKCEMLKKYCIHSKLMKGGFGSVYLPEEKIPPIDIKIAIKEIDCGEHQTHHHQRAVNNEQVASRVMHFAIVPLLAMGSDIDNRMYWFVSPRLEKGDLHTLISEDTERINKEEKIVLTRDRRIKMLYHIISAVHFLHADIKHFRGPIIHLDVKTGNVVADENYNARLTDFGVARETHECESSIKTTANTNIPLSDGYYVPPRFGILKKSYDYYNIGVVIMELLTGLPPCFQDENGKHEKLKCLTDEFMKEYYVQDTIWGDSASKEKLKQLAQFCFVTENNKSSDIPGNQTSQQILDESKSLLMDCGNGLAWERSMTASGEHDKCEMCMVNPSVANDLFSHKKCKQPLKVCVSCMRNSYLNPLLCHSCFQEIDPLIGGSKSGAILVAGQYSNNRDLTDLCIGNITAVEETITSKCPLVMGLRHSLVKRIPKKEGQPLECVGVITQIRNAFIEFKEKGLKTIFIYFSGLYSEEDGFVFKDQDAVCLVQSRDKQNHLDKMSSVEFQEILQTFLDRTENETRVIIILDCPGAPFLNFDDPNMQKKTVQLKSCLPDLKNSQNLISVRGLFTKAFLQGLKRKDKNSCFLHEESTSCAICPIEGKDFITIGNINTYISRHMKVIIDETAEALQSSTSDTKIAYLVDTNDKMNFTLQLDDQVQDCEISCSYYYKMSQLKKVLFKEFMDKMDVDKKKGTAMELNVDTYYDILGIFIRKGPTDQHKVELLELEQVLSAWNGKRELFVEMRKMIENGIVGVFSSEMNRNVCKLVENWECDKIEAMDKIIYKIEIGAFITKSKNTTMKSIGLQLSKIRKQVEPAELQISMPIFPDEHHESQKRDDFLCYKIERLKPLNNCD